MEIVFTIVKPEGQRLLEDWMGLTLPFRSERQIDPERWHRGTHYNQITTESPCRNSEGIQSK